MEALQIKESTQLGLGLAPQSNDLQLADLVCDCLSGPRGVAVHFALCLVAVHARLLHEVVHALVQAPAQAMDAGVDDQADSSHHLHREPTEQLDGGAVQTHLLAEILKVMYVYEFHWMGQLVYD